MGVGETPDFVEHETSLPGGVRRGGGRELRELLAALRAVDAGNLDVRLPPTDDPLIAEIAAAFNAVAERLALGSRRTSAFLANMSHELRTPLHSLLILARLLSENREGSLTEKQMEFARTIYSSGTDLLDLINDILDLSKVEAGKMDVIGGDVPLADVRDVILRTFAPLAEQKQIEFRVNVASDAPSTIVTDGQRLQQILKNLIANAFRFTDRGSVTLEIRRAEHDRRYASRSLDSAGEVVAFIVSDTGIGIAREKQQLIFEPFQQAGGTTSGRSGGTGLGLSISREFARLLGGELRVESVPAQGSAFTLYLPVRTSMPAGSPERLLDETAPFLHRAEPRIPEGKRGMIGQLLDSDASLARKRVLIVDDDLRNIFSLASVLEDQDMIVSFAENGRDAVDVLEREGAPTVDLVLMDIVMPEMDGYETIRRVRGSPRYRGLPIIALTAKAMKGDREKSIAAGASDYITKPVHTGQLLSLMREWLHR